MKGVVNLYKPRGWTSRDAVNKVRNLLGVKDVGHMGTLDPQGEGVLAYRRRARVPDFLTHF